MFEDDFVQEDEVVETEPEIEVEAEPEVEEPEHVDNTPTEEADPQPQSRDNDFARMRRSMEEQFKSSTEYKLAQKLADKYGVSTQEMMERLEEQELQEKATQQNIPVDVLKRIQSLESENNRIKEERIVSQIKSQIDDFQGKNPDVKQEELAPALQFLGQAHRMGLEHMTLEQAFKATNPNYETQLRERLRQEVLAEMAKSDTPIVTKGTSPNVNTNRTADDLQDDEFDKLLERVKNGERITKL